MLRTARLAARRAGRRDGRSSAGACWRPVVLAALVAVPLAGCTSFSERWAEGRFDGISYEVLYNIVLTTVDAEGYVVRYRDPQKGSFESEWVPGISRRVLRGPSRRKVYARIEPAGEDGYLVRLRVAEEVIRKGGMLAVNVRASEDWEAYEDNYEDAEFLMARIVGLIRAEGLPLPPAPEAAGEAVGP